MTPPEKTRTDGWAIPDAEKKSHYFLKGTSLCRRWRYSGACASEPRPMGNHCRVCALKVGEI